MSHLVPKTGVDAIGRPYTRMVNPEAPTGPGASTVAAAPSAPATGGDAFEVDDAAYYERLVKRVEDPYEDDDARRAALAESVTVGVTTGDVAASLDAEGWSAPESVEDPNVSNVAALTDLISEGAYAIPSEDGGEDEDLARHLVENGVVRDRVGLRIRAREETNAATAFASGFSSSFHELAVGHSVDGGLGRVPVEFTIDEEDRVRIAEDSAAFLAENVHELAAYANRVVVGGVPLSLVDAYSSAGHDYMVTRNGHGSGFEYRGLGALGERLAGSASDAGLLYAVVEEEDGKAYVTSL